MRRKPQVIDFFCGAGGFSEGFRQQGFEIVMGIDSWALAIETHNLNHNLNDQTKNVLDFGSSIDEINKLPNTEIIVGSPPCVLFSLSNKGGKVDKTLGIQLIESYLRVIAVKKHQPLSKLVAWFMENVPNSKNFIQPTYSFRQLKLTEWAENQKINPDAIALNASKNGVILNTADFGTSQRRERFVCGEIVASGNFPDLSSFMSKEHCSISTIKCKMPPPNIVKSDKIYIDPNYPSLKFRVDEITDHFYDSGIYESQWKSAFNAKKNHPYMGKMSFPEDESKPSRTIMATRSLTTREALVYKSEYDRKGNGEYRLPTIREIATLMGFPYSYQFSGSENNKCRQIGNAVCPPLSSALAKSVRLFMGLQVIPDSQIEFHPLDLKTLKLVNLNTFSETRFGSPPKKNPKARFRRHPFKDANMTVALTNFNPKTSNDAVSNGRKWHSSIFLGTGKEFVVKTIRKSGFKRLGKLIEAQHRIQGKQFINEFDKRFKDVIGKTHRFQDAYTGENPLEECEPGRLVEEIGNFILKNEPQDKYMIIPNLLPGKVRIPTRQVFAMYAINKLIS